MDAIRDEILKQIESEFGQVGIGAIVERFRGVLNEFHTFSGPYRARTPKYNAILENAIKTITKIYGPKPQPVYIFHETYSTDRWGPLYWNFLHLMSVLIAHAYEMNHIDSFLDFALIVANIDLILPCPTCVAHYGAIKNKPEMQEIVRSIAYGNVVNGLRAFHNAVSANVQHYNVIKRPTFNIAQFAERYMCYESHEVRVYTSYVSNRLDWQAPTHIAIAIVLSVQANIFFTLASDYIKTGIYRNSFPDSLRFVFHDFLKPCRASENELLDNIARGLLLRFESGPKIKELAELPYFHGALVHVYRQHGGAVRALLDMYMPGGDGGGDGGGSEPPAYEFASGEPPTRAQLLSWLKIIGGGSLPEALRPKL